MKSVATLCLLNLLTVRGSEDEKKTALEKFYGKMQTTKTEVLETEAYIKCEDAYKKKYEWTDKEATMKKLCEGIEEDICVVENDITKKFVEKLTGQDKEVCTNYRQAAVSGCKMALVGNKCKADCDKFSSEGDKPTPPSSASGLTTSALFLTVFAFNLM